MYDGHKVNLTQESQQAINERFRSLRYPKCSSRFNCIEYLFSVIKNNFRKVVLENCINLKNKKQNDGDLYYCVETAIAMLTPDTVK